jgi:hypothetical protein
MPEEDEIEHILMVAVGPRGSISSC